MLYIIIYILIYIIFGLNVGLNRTHVYEYERQLLKFALEFLNDN